MSIAKHQYEGIGLREFTPSVIGLAGQTPLPEWAFGTAVGGDNEGEFVYLWFAPTATITLNQGDWVSWDNSYGVAASLLGAAYHQVGANFGTIFYGARVGDPAAAAGQGIVWSFAFQAGTVYGIWVQRAGTSLANLTITNANKQVSTTATPSNLAQVTSAAANSMTVSGVGAPAASFSLASTVINANSTLTLASGTDKAKGLYKGLYLSGTGVPNGAYITDIQGLTISFANPGGGTITPGTQTVTASANTFWGTITNGSPTITGVPSIPGVYPNQTLSGTGTTGTIASITGVPGNYTITMSGNAGAGNAFASACTVSGYLEAFLRWPYGQTQN